MKRRNADDDGNGNGNGNGNGETNVEAIVAEVYSQMPFEDPDACRAVPGQLAKLIEVALESRAQRHKGKKKK